MSEHSVSETPANEIDELLRQFQRACEDVVVQGDSNLSATTKLRAVLRNDLRARLLARSSSPETPTATAASRSSSSETTAMSNEPNSVSETPGTALSEETDKYLVFDVESVGLHGDAFAVGFVMLDATTGEVTHSQRAWCDPNICAQGTYSDREWVRANVPAFDESDQCASPRALRDWFWRNWLFAKSLGARMAADVAWPVEANFLARCIADDPIARQWEGPYPLIDIASVRLACGFDPLATEARRENETAHDPLCDSRQSARLLSEALRERDSQREEIARLTKEREEAAALPSSRALSEEERCANCGKDYGNHFDGPFCFKNHGSESEDGAQWRVRSTPSNDQKRAATLILALLEWVGYDTLDGDAQRTCDEARKLVDRLTGAPK